MPKWIHNRADHLLKKNPDMNESMAFAIATTQHKKMEKQAEGEHANLLKILGGLAGGEATSVGAQALSPKLDELIQRELADNPALAQELLEKIRGGSPVPVHDVGAHIPTSFVPSGIQARATEHMHGVRFDSDAVMVGDRSSPSIVAHEIGHAEIHANPLGKLIQNPFTGILGRNARGLGYVSGGLSAMSDDPEMKALGLAAPAIAAAPELVYEAAASLLGLRRLRNAGANPAQMGHALRQLGTAFSSYGLSAASGVANAALAQGTVGSFRDAFGSEESLPKEAALTDEIRAVLGEQTTSPIDRLKASLKHEATTLSENPMPAQYLTKKITGGQPLSKLGHVEFNAFVDELIKDAEAVLSGGPAPTRFQKFMSGAKGEAGPAIGATLGAGLAKAYGVDPLAGAAAGYGIGALPEVVHALTRKMAATDEELRETGRQRAVTSLAADAHRDAGRRGERAGGAVGALGGAVGGAALGRKLIGGAPGTIAGLVGGYVAGSRVGKELGGELDIKKNAFALSPFAGQPAQNPPGMRMASPAPPVTVPALATKQAFQTSQYSGPLSYGPFKMTSGIPPFRSPAMTKMEPSAEKAWMTGGEKTGGMNTALDSMGPLGRLTQTQRVGAPKTTGVAGPSIADISKPHGFGTPLAGATKSF